MAGIFSYSKKEKLKSRKQLQSIFASKQFFLVHPIKVFYGTFPIANDASQALQVGVGVSSRNFKKAVERNRIKRILREAYRLNKPAFDPLGGNEAQLALFFLFIGKELPELDQIMQKIPTIIQKLQQKLHETDTTNS